ncbi:MAG: LysR family transcriptional regulator [Cyclobacteriaceae bacterium]|nr:LysR family transcriptional regulator [Cyclobacteriaceae bacterium]
MNYTLNQLQVFLKVTQTESVTRAAEELNLSQPAVSIQLRNLQDQFDIPLTELVGRKLHITEFGREIARSADAILQQVASINNKTSTYKGLLTGRLKLSVVSTGKYMMPYFLAPFMNKNASLELNMMVTNRSGVIASLEDNAVDFAFVSILPKAPAVDKMDLVENKLFMVGKGGSGFKKSSYPKSILKDLPLIFREEGSGTRMEMDDFIRRNRLSVIRKMELNSNEAVKQSVMAGLGYSIMPHIGIKNELENGSLQIIPVTGMPIRNTWRLIWLKGKQHGPVAAAFLEFIRKEKDEIISRQFGS